MSTDCFCDFDPPEFYKATMRKARKAHRCNECGGTIRTGETYERVAGRWDGVISTFVTCPRCLALKAYTLANVPCACLTHGNILDDCRETIQQYAHELPGLMTGFYRRWVMVFRQANQGVA